MIAVRRVENGQFVYHQYPSDEITPPGQQPIHKNACERFQQPRFRSEDYNRCLHYQTGYIIDDWANTLVRRKEMDLHENAIGYNIEIIVTPVFEPKKEEEK